MWRGFTFDPDAEHRGGSYGVGVEKEFVHAQDTVSRQVSGVHPQRHGRPRASRLAIMRGAFTTPGPQFNSSLRDVLHGFDPFLGLGMMRSADDSFQRLTYGGDLMRQGVGPSGPARIVAHPTAEKETPVDIPPPHPVQNNRQIPPAPPPPPPLPP